MKVVLMGPPGAGKGTQAERLVKKFGMTHLSSGDIFRAAKASGSELGRKLGEYMEAGELVPDEIVVDVMANAITEADDSKGLLLDGFPRTVAQAKALDEQLSQAGQPLDAVVVITAEEGVIADRITGRRSCPECGKLYHVKNMPPTEDNVCDECGVELIQRKDDTAEVVRERLAAYHRQTEPVIEYYRNRDGRAVLEFDGTSPVDEVTDKIAAAMESIQARS